MEQQTDTVELRIALAEQIVRDLLWQALAPEALVITNALSEAIAKQQDMLGVSLDGYQLSGISITVEAGTMYAELTYTMATG
jgi:hypothetical protein